MLEIADKLDALKKEEIDAGRICWDTLKLGYGADELRRLAKARQTPVMVECSVCSKQLAPQAYDRHMRRHKD